MLVFYYLRYIQNDKEMINFEVIDKLKNLDENENILEIIDIFYWKIYKKWLKYWLIIKDWFN